jgi:peptidase E
MTETCFDRGSKSSSADQMKSALVGFYKGLGVKYQGDFHFVSGTNEWHGNPAQTDTVKSFILKLRHFDCSAERSQPMSYRDCEKVEEWFKSDECNLNQYQVELFRMAMATGFTLWYASLFLLKVAKR